MGKNRKSRSMGHENHSIQEFERKYIRSAMVSLANKIIESLTRDFAETPGGYMTKEEMVIAAVAAIQTAEAQALSEKLAEMYEAGKLSVVVPEDITPFSQADLDKAVFESTETLKGKIAELETQLSQKDADSLEEAIAEELAAMAQKLRDRTVKAPVDPVPAEEETKGTDAEA